VTEADIAIIREHDLELEVATLYSEALPYHNFRHVLTTVEAAQEILARCAHEGIRVDSRIVYYALLFHDAGYQHDHRALGHASKEHYSVLLALDCLKRHRHGERVLKKVESAILSTMRTGSFVTAEQKVVRAADLSGLASTYDDFLRNTKCLWDECAILTGQRMSWADWIRETTETVQFYLSQEIRLTSYFMDHEGESAFHARVRANLDRLQREQAPTDNLRA